MEIKDKRDSFEEIKRLGLNRVPEIIATKEDIEAVAKFLDRTNASVYVLRDTKHAIGKTYFLSSKSECLEKIKHYDGTFSLAVSIKSYSGRVLIGDIMVSGDNVDLSASTDPECDHRHLDQIALYCQIDDNRLWNVPGFADIIKYVTEKNLYDVIVEFAVFDHGVGEKKENVVIVELRSEY